MAFRLAWVPPDIEREPERDLMKIYNAFTYCPCKKCLPRGANRPANQKVYD